VRAAKDAIEKALTRSDLIGAVAFCDIPSPTVAVIGVGVVENV
jgi:hypothetical protein